MLQQLYYIHIQHHRIEGDEDADKYKGPTPPNAGLLQILSHETSHIKWKEMCKMNIPN
jgi:hypothetical protein